MRLSCIAIVALALAASACQAPRAQPLVTVENAWVRLPAVAGRPGAAYFTLDAAAPDILLEVTTPAGRAEMHESMEQGAGMAAMRPLETLAIAEGETRFEAGGKHVMLYDVDPAVRPGGSVALTLRFSKAPAVTVDARTIGAGDPPPPG